MPIPPLTHLLVLRALPGSGPPREEALRLPTTSLLTHPPARLQRKKKRQPSAALNSLPLLSEVLAEVAAEREGAAAGGVGAGGRPKRRQLGTSVGSLRARDRVAEKEAPRMQQVMQHPQFQANPIAAIASHLSATLPPPPPPQRLVTAEEQQQLRRDKKWRQRQRTSTAKAAAAGAMVHDD